MTNEEKIRRLELERGVQFRLPVNKRKRARYIARILKTNQRARTCE